MDAQTAINVLDWARLLYGITDKTTILPSRKSSIVVVVPPSEMTYFEHIDSMRDLPVQEMVAEREEIVLKRIRGTPIHLGYSKRLDVLAYMVDEQ